MADAADVRMPIVVVVHDDTARRIALVQSLAPLSVSDHAQREDAVRQLKTLAGDGDEPTSAVKLVVAPARDARKWLRDLDRYAPEAHAVFLSTASESDELSELSNAAADGYRFTTFDDGLPVADLAARILRLVAPRRSTRFPQRPGGFEVSFDIHGSRFRGTLADVSSTGLSIALSTSSQVERLAEGAVVSEVRVTAGERLCLSSDSGQIRRLALPHSADGQTHIGIHLAAETTLPVGRDIRDRVRARALLYRALRRKSPVQVAPADGGVPVTLTSPEYEQNGKTTHLRASTSLKDRFALGDVLQMSFELLGRAYAGPVVVVRAVPGSVSLSLPTALVEKHRRQFVRRVDPLRSDTAIVVSYRSPFIEGRMVRVAMDHHASGMGILIDPDYEPIPPGTWLEEVTVRFSTSESFSCRAQVRHVTTFGTAAESRRGAQQCGLELFDVPEACREKLFAAVISSTSASIRSASDLPFGEIWTFIREAGRHWKDYPAASEGPHIAVLSHAHDALRAAHGLLGKTFVHQEEGKLVGHANGIRLYDSTWMLQHLTVLPGFHRNDTISQKLSSLVVDYGEALPDIDWIRYMWFTETRWTSRLSTWVARRIHREGLSDLRFATYMHLEPGVGVPFPDPALPVREATASDLAWIESYFRRNGDWVRLRSDDWAASKIGLDTLDARMKPFGLSRARSVFVVGSTGQPEAGPPLAFAFADRASWGLCWPEFTNAFRLFVPNRTDPAADMARKALTAHVVADYRRRGQAYGVALAEDADVPLLLAMGFTSVGRTVEWTFHRTLVRPWQELATALFERLSRSKLANHEKAA